MSLQPFYSSVSVSMLIRTKQNFELIMLLEENKQNTQILQLNVKSGIHPRAVKTKKCKMSTS